MAKLNTSAMAKTPELIELYEARAAKRAKPPVTIERPAKTALTKKGTKKALRNQNTALVAMLLQGHAVALEERKAALSSESQRSLLAGLESTLKHK